MKKVVILAVLILAAVSGFSADYSIRKASAPGKTSASGNVEVFVESKIVVEDVSVNPVMDKVEAVISNEEFIDMSAVAMGVGIF